VGKNPREARSGLQLENEFEEDKIEEEKRNEEREKKIEERKKSKADRELARK
jgi:hypothetical protein